MSIGVVAAAVLLERSVGPVVSLGAVSSAADLRERRPYVRRALRNM